MKNKSTTTVPKNMADYFLGQAKAPKVHKIAVNSFSEFFTAPDENDSETDTPDSLLQQELTSIISQQEELLKLVKTLKPKTNSEANLKQELAAIAENQEALLKDMETIHSNLPSKLLSDFFKSFKFDIDRAENFMLKSQLTAIEEDLKDPEYIKNLKRIPRSGNAKLKAQLKRYKPLLTEGFIEKARDLNLTIKDTGIAMAVLLDVKTLITDIKYFDTSLTSDTNPES